jgi:hypothetical protein
VLPKQLSNKKRFGKFQHAVALSLLISTNLMPFDSEPIFFNFAKKFPPENLVGVWNFLRKDNEVCSNIKLQ